MKKCPHDQNPINWALNNLTDFFLEEQENEAHRMCYRKEKTGEWKTDKWNEIRRDFHSWLIAIQNNDQSEIERIVGLYVSINEPGEN